MACEICSMNEVVFDGVCKACLESETEKTVLPLGAACLTFGHTVDGTTACIAAKTIEDVLVDIQCTQCGKTGVTRIVYKDLSW